MPWHFTHEIRIKRIIDSLKEALEEARLRRTLEAEDSKEEGSGHNRGPATGPSRRRSEDQRG